MRSAIRTGLEDAGHDVRIDFENLKPGDHWRAELHEWLGICDGAVLLLDEDTIRSEWVRKEATLLTWRANLGSLPKLIPVFLSGLRLEDLGAATSAAKQLKRGGLRREDLAALLDRIVPLWASIEAAQHLHAVVRRGARPEPVLTVELPSVAWDLVQRAYCCQLDRSDFVEFTAKGGESPLQAVRQLENALATDAGIKPTELKEDPQKLDRWLKHIDSPLLVLVGPGAVRQDVLDALRTRFGERLRLILLGGTTADEAIEDWQVKMILPVMTPNDEEHAVFDRRYAERLLGAG